MLAPIFSDSSTVTKEESDKKYRQKAPEIKEPENRGAIRGRRITKQAARDFATPSVKDALQGKFKNEEEKISKKEQFQLHSQNSEETSFTKEQLELKWNDFLSQIKENHNLKATLTELPEIKPDWVLEKEVDNSVQLGSINTIKPELVSFLRKELKNSKISLEIKISKDIRNKIIYTDEDKFDKMSKKNPAINQLKKRLNLDFGEV